MLSEEQHKECSDKKENKLAAGLVLSDEAAEEFQRCCGKNGICSHEVLRDGELDRNCNTIQSKMMRKVAFLLVKHAIDGR